MAVIYLPARIRPPTEVDTDMIELWLKEAIARAITEVGEKRTYAILREEAEMLIREDMRKS